PGDEPGEQAASEAASSSAAATRTEGSALRRRYRLASSARSSNRNRACTYESGIVWSGFIRRGFSWPGTLRVYASPPAIGMIAGKASETTSEIRGETIARPLCPELTVARVPQA